MDEFAWLKDREDPRVIAHLRAENARTEEAMRHTGSLQEALYEEMVGRIQETDRSAPTRIDDYHYYHRTEAGKQYRIWARRKGHLEADEEVLLDANELADGHDFFRIGVFEPSPDHRHLAYSYDTSGSEAFTLVVRELTSGRLLPEMFENTAYSLAWASDGRSFFYAVRDGSQRAFEVYRHQLDTPPSADVRVYHEPGEAFSVTVRRSRSKRYILIEAESATTREVRYLEADRPEEPPRLFRPRRHGIEYTIHHHGDGFYVRSNDGAKNFRLDRAPILADGSIGDRWTEVVPGRADVRLEGVEVFRDHLVLVEREEGFRRLRVWEIAGGRQHTVQVPESVCTLWPGENPRYDTVEFRFVYSSPVTPETVIDYDMDARTSTVVKRQEVRGGYRPTDYAAERIFAEAEDGVRIPITLVYRVPLARDHTKACLLTGYGAYGLSLDPAFSSHSLSLLDRGFVCATAHVRGGGELGEEWHEQGRMRNKRTTFTDFIACAEHLVSEGFTSPDRLAIRGRSAGGLVMGVVSNMRPDLFAAVIAGVPFVDVLSTMLDPTIPLTVTEYEEWGDPREEEYFRYIRSYSPFDNVERKSYPPILATVGLHDSRVQFWEPVRWVARLRARKTDSNRLLLRTDLEAGHGGPSGRYDTLRELAFEYAFLLDTVGAGEAENGRSAGARPAAHPARS